MSRDVSLKHCCTLPLFSYFGMPLLLFFRRHHCPGHREANHYRQHHPIRYQNLMCLYSMYPFQSTSKIASLSFLASVALKAQENSKAVKATCFWYPVSPNEQGSLPHQSLLNDMSQLPPSPQGIERHTLFNYSTALMWPVFANQKKERNLTSHSLTIYFHHHSAKSRSAKFVCCACHRVGSFTTALTTRLAQETKVYTVPRLRNTLGASPLSFSSEENPRTLSAQPCVRVIKGCPLLFSVSIL